MTPQQINNCLAFLNRADIKGGEVPAFVEVVNALHALAAPKADGLVIEPDGGEQALGR